ncbi:putative RING-H2 finger protein ATL21C [Arabidopsis thaliana]
MTFSKQLFPFVFFLLFLVSLRHASNPNNCSSSSSRPLRCGPLEVPIRFPICNHARFNLHCTDLNKTVLELPMSGTFLVRDIDYRRQKIYINDP